MWSGLRAGRKDLRGKCLCIQSFGVSEIQGPEAATGTQSWQNMAGLPAPRTRGLTTFSISQPTRRH